MDVPAKSATATLPSKHGQPKLVTGAPPTSMVFSSSVVFHPFSAMYNSVVPGRNVSRHGLRDP